MCKPLLLMTCIALTLAACEKNKTGDTNHQIQPANRGSTIDTVGRNAKATIFVQEFTGDNHVGAAKRYKDHLLATSNMPDWHTVTGRSKTTLYYGYYEETEDPRHPHTALAQADKKRISELKNAVGDPMFRYTLIVPLDKPYEGPPEFDLRNAPEQAYWTLQIAVYHGSPERKQAAVESVKQAREQGVYAWYYHGDQSSVVTVGLWREGAVTMKSGDSTRYSDRPGGANDEVIVLTRPIPADAPEYAIIDGKRFRIVAPRISINDASVTRMMKQYPHHHDNGEIMSNKVKGAKEGIPERTFLLKIPRDQTMAGGNQLQPTDSRFAPGRFNPQRDRSTEGLRGLGDR